MPDPLDLPPYVSARALVADALDALLPRARITVRDWTARHRYVRGANAGLWDQTVAPYLEEPMEQFDAPGVEEIALVGPGRSGKTTLAENLLLKTVKSDAAPVGWYANTDDVVKAYVKTVINPLLDDHDCARAPGDTSDSLSFKRFLYGTTVEFLAATDASFRNKTFRLVVADEYDGYDPALGDARGLLNQRRATEGAAGRTVFVSHPDLAEGEHASEWRRGIMAIYAASTRCTWWWPCPHCGAWSSPNPGTARPMVLHYAADAPLDVIAAETRLLCPVNGCLIEDRHRRAMNRQGRWIGTGEAISQEGTLSGTRTPNAVVGYWIVGAMSPFLLGGIGGLARARVAAERAVAAHEENAERTLRAVMTKQWGIPYSLPRAVDQVTAVQLADRAEPGLQLGVVPAGVRFLTAFVDVQGNRFELLVRGWGEAGESWVIAADTIPAEPTTSASDWDLLMQRLLTASYPLADGSGRVMRIRGAGYDAYGAPGTTLHAYAAWRRWRVAGKLGLRGRIDGREAWNIIPTKGLGGPNAPPLSTVRPDTQRRDRHAAAGGTVPIAQFNANTFKDALASQLVTAAGAFSVHIPAALRSPAEPHIWFEGLVAETRQPNRTWKHSTAFRNEPTDLMVGTHVIAHLHGLAKLNWALPPAWAAPWEQNSMIGPPSSTGAPVPAVVSHPPPPPAAAPVASAPLRAPIVAPVQQRQAFNPGFIRAGRRLA